MLGLLKSRLFFWGGITVMAISVALGVVCIIVFVVTGRKLKKKLEQEYGKPQL